MISLLPQPGDTTSALTNLTFLQFLSKHFGVIVGKISLLGGDDNAFGHDYHTTFMYTALDFNAAFLDSSASARRVLLRLRVRCSMMHGGSVRQNRSLV